MRFQRSGDQNTPKLGAPAALLVQVRQKVPENEAPAALSYHGYIKNFQNSFLDVSDCNQPLSFVSGFPPSILELLPRCLRLLQPATPRNSIPSSILKLLPLFLHCCQSTCFDSINFIPIACIHLGTQKSVFFSKKVVV